VLADAERVASEWSAAARNGTVPHLIPTTGRINLIQLVDVDGRVVDYSKAAPARRPISTLRPPAPDRLQKRSEGSSQGGCGTFLAIRPPPAANAEVISAGRATPPILTTHRLEYLLLGGIAPVVFLAAWTTWSIVGRTLRPVAAIRARMSE